MTELDKLFHAFSQFAGLKEDNFELSKPYWQYHEYKKGDFYNRQRTVCKYLGFVLQGVFRSYIIDDKSGEEKNVFLYPSNGFVVSFKSFINQIPCDYQTQAITDAMVVQIHISDLQNLYRQSHEWERVGRLLAQEAFNVAMSRVEGFVFKTPEERYIELVERSPELFNTVPLYHISSYLGIQGPSLSRIRKRLLAK